MKANVAVAMLAVLLLSGAPAARASPESIDVSGYPPKYQELYKLVEVRCSKCHSLSRVKTARLKADEWKNYVKKMSRRTGSGISPEVGDKIVEFLKYRAELKANPDAGSE